VATHINSVLIKKLEIKHFGDACKKKPKGMNLPLTQSFSHQEEEDVDGTVYDKEEADSSSDDGGAQESSDEELPNLNNSPRLNIFASVVAMYEGEWFLATIHSDQSDMPAGYTRPKYMSIKGSNSFVWAKDDLHVTLNEDILIEPVEPVPVNSCGHLGLPEKDYEKVLLLMVVGFFSQFLGSFLPRLKNFNFKIPTDYVQFLIFTLIL
jgi:hypothetical protein